VRFGLVFAALFLVLAASARAGTYDVVTCSPSGPGGANNAWVRGPVLRGFGEVTPQIAAGFTFLDDCATVGVMVRSGRTTPFAGWLTYNHLQFTAPTDALITRLVLWRQSLTQTTPAGGSWRINATLADGSELGGPSGPDQCKPGLAFQPDPCTIGRPGFGEDTISRYDVSTSRVRLGLQCTSEGATYSCDTEGSEDALAFFRLKAAIVTVRDDTLPALDVRGGVVDPGWHRPDAAVAVTSTDNSGVRSVRLLVNGQEQNRVDLPCDYTRPRPCPDADARQLVLGTAVSDGRQSVQVVAEDAAGNLSTLTRDVQIDGSSPGATLTRASGRTITVRVSDGASGLATGTIEVRNRPNEPFRALPTKLADGRLTARLDRGSASRVGIRVSVSDNAGNITAGHLSEMSLRVGGSSLRGGAASVGYGRSARVTGRLLTRDGQPLAQQSIGIESTPRVTGASAELVATVSTDARGRFTYRAPAGVSRTLRLIFAGASDLAPLARTTQLRVRASSTISASRRVLSGRGRVRFSGRVGLRGATTPRSGKIVELQAYDGGRWRVFATARARGSKGRWSAAYTFAGTPGRYPVRLRIRREAVFPYDLGYSRSVVIRVR
jgi:hypothetical protein